MSFVPFRQKKETKERKREVARLFRVPKCKFYLLTQPSSRHESSKRKYAGF